MAPTNTLPSPVDADQHDATPNRWFRAGAADVAHRRLLGPLELAYVLLAASLTSSAALPELRRSIEMSETVASLHTSFFGWCLLAGGVASPLLARVARRRRVLASLGFMGIGAGVFASATSVAMSLGGALVLGLGAALLVLTVPGVVADIWPDDRMGVFTWLNIPPAIGGLVFPLVLSGALALGVSWRLPVSAVMALAPLAVLLLLRLPAETRVALDAGHEAAAQKSAVAAAFRVRRFRSRFVLQVLGVGLEFAIGSFAVLYLSDVAGLGDAFAPLGAAAWAIGMITSRTLTSRMISLCGARLEASCFACFAVGGALLLIGPHPVPRLFGISVAAFGIAPVYVLGVERLFGALHGDTEPGSGATVSAVAGFASGVGITVGPLVVGTLGDRFGLTRALLVPICCSAAMALAALVRAGRTESEIGGLGRVSPR